MSQQTNDPDEMTVNVAQRLRMLREQRHLSQRELADSSGLSPNTLSLLERGRTSPTVTTLTKLAIALGVDINAFFEPVAENSIVYTRATDQQHLSLSRGSMADLGIGMHERLVIPLLLRLEPGGRSGDVSSLSSHQGQEFIYCLSGELLYMVDGQSFLLETGDSLFFDGQLPHRFQNTGSHVVEILVIWARPRDSFEVEIWHSIGS